MLWETGALVQRRDGEGPTWGHECPMGEQIVHLRSISEAKMLGLGDCGMCEETEGRLEILKDWRCWDLVNRDLSLKP